MNAIRRTALWTAVILSCMGSIYVTGAMGRQRVVLGSVEGGWIYPFLQPLRVWTVAIGALAVAASWAALALGGNGAKGRVWRVLLLWFGVGLAIEALLRSLTPFSLTQMFVSDSSNSFYSVTRRYFASSVLREYLSLRQVWPLHAQSNLPGKLMLIYALKRISRSPDVLVWLTLFVSNLGMFPMYWFARDVFDDATVGLWSAVLYLAVPAKLFFFPLMNTVTPVVILVCACLLMRWIRTGWTIFPAVLGAAIYGLVFFEPLPLVMGLLFLALILHAVATGSLSPARCALQGAVGVAAFAVTYFVMKRETGFDLWPAFKVVTIDATSFNTTEGRPYGIWVRQNLWDFAFATGVCQSVLILAALADGLVDTRRARGLAPAALLSGGLLLTLLVIDLLGVNRGEIIRLWIFLACFFQIPAAYVCARLESRLAMGVVLGTTLLQTALGTAMVGFILPG